MNDSAKDLFLRICQVDPMERYTAGQALVHPWIQRNSDAEIPKNLRELMAEYQSELKSKRIISLLLFVSYCMKENNI